MDIVKHYEYSPARFCMRLREDQLAAWKELSAIISSRAPSSMRLLVLAAHPDDESIGASSLLPQFSSYVAYLTDGAPRDSALWAGGQYESHEVYATIRRGEAEKALSVAGVSPDRVFWLGGKDQEAAFEIGRLTEKLAARLRELKPDALVTHPYEGGHPDHDSAALIAQLAINQIGGSTQLVEMNSYHADNGVCVKSEFLPVESCPVTTIELSRQEQYRKKEMFKAHNSQRILLGTFRTDRELFRPAPAYDFSWPPHEGKLWYEYQGWPMTGKRWRELAAAELVHSSKSMQSRSCG